MSNSRELLGSLVVNVATSCVRSAGTATTRSLKGGVGDDVKVLSRDDYQRIEQQTCQVGTGPGAVGRSAIKDNMQHILGLTRATAGPHTFNSRLLVMLCNKVPK